MRGAEGMGSECSGAWSHSCGADEQTELALDVVEIVDPDDERAAARGRRSKVV